MTNKTTTTLSIAALFAAPAVAFAAVSVGDTIGTTEAEIRANLESKGYVINEIEFEDDEIEVEVIYEGQEFEIELAVNNGTIVEIELEDDDN